MLRQPGRRYFHCVPTGHFRFSQKLPHPYLQTRPCGWRNLAPPGHSPQLIEMRTDTATSKATSCLVRIPDSVLPKVRQNQATRRRRCRKAYYEAEGEAESSGRRPHTELHCMQAEAPWNPSTPLAEHPLGSISCAFYQHRLLSASTTPAAQLQTPFFFSPPPSWP